MSNEELVSCIQAGDVEKMAELWEQVRRLVALKANRVYRALELNGRFDVEFDDLMQSGYLALDAAVRYYTPSDECSFATYLVTTLKTAFAEATGWQNKKHRNDPLNWALSLSAPIGNDPDDGTLEDIVSDPADDYETVDERDFAECRRKTIRRLFDTELTEWERTVLDLIYYEGLKRTEVSEKTGMTLDRVRQIEHRACSKLIKPRNRRKLEEYIDFQTNYYMGASAERQESAVEKIVLERERRYDRISVAARHNNDAEE